MRALITITDEHSFDTLGYTYSYSSWQSSQTDKSKIRSCLYGFVQKHKVKAEDIIITCPKKYWNKIQGRGYTTAYIKYSDEDRQRYGSAGYKRSTWLSSSTKATNDYANVSYVAYLLNKFYNPYLERFCTRRGLPVDNNAYALSELIQFIFRSRLRNGHPITLLLPSTRMRKLFEEWLYD